METMPDLREGVIENKVDSSRATSSKLHHNIGTSIFPFLPVLYSFGRSLHAPDTLICMRVPFGDQVCVVTLDLLLNPFDRLEVFDGLNVKLSSCILVHDDQRAWMQL